MGREIRKARYLSEISTVAGLKEARRELHIREWFARERLIEDVYDTFTLENLISVVAPPGSLIDRVIGGVGTGFTAFQGIIGVVGSLIGRKSAHGRSAATQAVHRRKSEHPVKRTSATRSAARKRSPEIEVEVELEPKRVVRSKK